MGIRRRRIDPKIRWLASQPWWSELNRNELTKLAARGDRTDLPAGHMFMGQDQQGREAAVVVSGELEIVHDDEVIARVGPGEVVGELSLLDERPRRNAGVRCATDVELLVFGIQDFQQIMHEVEPIRRQVRAAAQRHAG